ncbi:MAG: hypothetical protein JOY77_01985 [Alphaproteobacteria bacterium]|nr:hypothetical protein [Alphaproteobacteria bacterium]
MDGASATVAPQCDNNTPVAPNGACYLYTYSVGALHTCKLTFGSSAAKVRATLQSLDPNLNPRSSAELRQ